MSDTSSAPPLAAIMSDTDSTQTVAIKRKKRKSATTVNIPQINFSIFFEENHDHSKDNIAPPVPSLSIGTDAGRRIPPPSFYDKQQKEKKGRVVEQVRVACETQGFFYVTGHDAATLQTLSRALTQIRHFFDDDDLSQFKKQCHSRNSKLYRGYTQCGGGNNCTSKAKEPESKESFTVGAEGDNSSPMHGPNLWPRPTTIHDNQNPNQTVQTILQHEEEFCKKFQEDMTEYWEKMLSLARHIAHVLALSLNIKEDFFTSRLEDPVAQMVSFKYPPEDGNISCGEHTDCGFLTLLVQTAAGLEVYSSGNQEWVTVEPVQDAVLVNLGDLVQYWTKGRYLSTPHRVHNTNQIDRYSIVFFANCDFNARLDDLDEEKRNDNENTTTTSTVPTAGEYILKKLGLMYLMGEESP